MNDVTRDSINALQATMLKLPQLELPTEHYFADGMYARVVKHDAGIIVVGRVQKKEHFFIVAKGCVQIGKMVCPAGTIIVSKPGTKRAAIALEDSIIMTVHRTKKKSLPAIEKQLVEPDKDTQFDMDNKLKPKELT